MKSNFPLVRSLAAAAAVLGGVAAVSLMRITPTGASAKAPALPVTPAADIAAVQSLVTLSPSEEIVRTCGYQTIRVETTNRVAGYRTANYFARTAIGTHLATPKARSDSGRAV